MEYPDATVGELARLFREHPAWLEAAEHIREGGSSAVWFRHRPGEPWHLVRSGGRTELRPGPARDPDLVFRFPPAGVAALSRTEGDVGAFAVRLFELMIDPDPERRVELRVVSPFLTLVRRGYVRLLAEAGPEVAAFGARHGVTGLLSLRRLVAALRRPPFDWEREVDG